jgi:hypothetical protein
VIQSDTRVMTLGTGSSSAVAKPCDCACQRGDSMDARGRLENMAGVQAGFVRSGQTRAIPGDTSAGADQEQRVADGNPARRRQ